MPSLTPVEYSFELVNTKKKQAILFTQLIILFSWLLIGYWTLTTEDSFIQKKLMLFGFFIPLVSILMERFFIKPHQTPYSLHNILFWLSVTWWQAELVEAAWITLTFLVLSLMATRKLWVQIGPNGISYPSLPSKKFPWTTVSQVILKDGLLTIDKKDNTLIQQMIINTSSINEALFNSYCQLQIKND